MRIAGYLLKEAALSFENSSRLDAPTYPVHIAASETVN
jgi:hypothetical protein